MCIIALWLLHERQTNRQRLTTCHQVYRLPCSVLQSLWGHCEATPLFCTSIIVFNNVNITVWSYICPHIVWSPFKYVDLYSYVLRSTHSLSSIDHQSCEIIMKEKTPLSHRVVCCQMLDFETLKILNLWSRNQIQGKLLLSQKLRHFRGSCFSQCFMLSTSPHYS